jgi:hypothetical protein
MTKNMRKFLSYAEAWRRIAAATEDGYYFEVVTLCESIIADRLLSYVTGVNPKSKATVTTTFGGVIKEWRSLDAGKLPELDGIDLGARVDAWRSERNAIVHGLAKSAPGTPTEPLFSFIERAKVTAAEGRALADEVSKWFKQQRAIHGRGSTRK